MCDSLFRISTGHQYSEDNCIIFIFSTLLDLYYYYLSCTIYSFKTHLLNSAVFVTAVTSSLERLKASLRTVFPSELVLDPIPDNHVDQHLAAMLTAHNHHQQATHTSGCNSSILPPPSSTSNTLNSDDGDVDYDYDAGLKDAVKVTFSHLLLHMHCNLFYTNCFLHNIQSFFHFSHSIQALYDVYSVFSIILLQHILINYHI